ncbi:MAG: prolipoprotein diacylglyceryl transferase [Acidobacteria bacterium]|nr:prolipoprotein diacylglyceryl transferase [Acidobacteriota bacterium]
MYPVLFDLDLGRLGQFAIGTYGLFYAIGFLLALRVGVYYARRDGLSTARIVDLGIVTLIAGFIGAKVLLYMLHADFYIENPRMILRSLRSAGVFYGGFALALLAAFLYIRRHRLPFGRVADLAAPAVAAGQTIGRLGCFFAGCCFGKVCELPWAVTFTNPRARELTDVTLNVPLHPTQLYHALANLGLFAITAFVMRRRRFDGQVFWIYVLLYALFRFTIEFLRGDHARGLYFGELLSTSQLIAIPVAFAAATLLVVLARRTTSIPERRRST